MSSCPKLSVIVPVYNVEEYLDWCLDSLLGQTLPDIEIVCVNDGSTDSSREILEQREARDSRIVIVDQENGGLSAARNTGIRTASAPLVCFLDSDDRFVPETCARIVDVFESTGADVVTFGANCYPKEAGYPWLEERLSPRNKVYAPFDPELLFSEMSRPYAWRTACRTSFLMENKLFFESGLRFGEDQVWHFAIYPRTSKTVLIKDKLYDYRVARKGSLMDRISNDSFTKMSLHLPIIEYIMADWQKGSLLEKYPVEFLEWTIDFVLFEMMSLPVEQRVELIGKLRDLWRSYYNDEVIARLPLRKATRKVLSITCDQERVSSDFQCKQAQAWWMYRRHGIKSALGTVLHNLIK